MCELCESGKDSFIDKDYHKNCSEAHIFNQAEFEVLFDALDLLARDVNDDTFTLNTRERKAKLKVIKNLEIKLNTL